MYLGIDKSEALLMIIESIEKKEKTRNRINTNFHTKCATIARKKIIFKWTKKRVCYEINPMTDCN